MDQAVPIIWDITKCSCICVKNEADYVYKLKDNLNLLEDNWEDLRSMKEDLEITIEEAEHRGGMRRGHQIGRWLKKVDGIGQEIKDIQDKGAQEIQKKCLSECCPKNCKSSYKIGKRVVKMVENVNGLATKGERFGRDSVIAHKIPSKSIEMPRDVTLTVGLKSIKISRDEIVGPESVGTPRHAIMGLGLMFDTVRHTSTAEKQNVAFLGLYGIGGTPILLKKINSEIGKIR